VTVPALYVAGDRDLVVKFRVPNRRSPTSRTRWPQLRKHIVCRGAVIGTQQERANESMPRMIGFLKSL